MITIDIQEKVDRKAWDKLVCSVPEGTVFQSASWADYLAMSGYGRPFFFTAKEDGKDLGALLMWIEPMTARTRPGNRVLAYCERISRRLQLSYGCWMYGPLIFDKSRRADILKAVLEGIDKFARREKIIFARSLGEPILYDSPPQDETLGHYAASRFRRSKKRTLYIDLSKGLNALWKGLKKYTRKDVKNCARHNLTVEFLDETKLADYSRLVDENMKRVKAPAPPHYPDRPMWDALRSNGERHLEVLAVRRGREMLGAVGILEYNGIIFQMGSCQSDDSYRKKINVNDLMTWEVVRWGVNNNRRVYDLTGIPVTPANSKEEGLLNFKMKWSDRKIEFNSYEKTYRNAVKFAVDAARRLIA